MWYNNIMFLIYFIVILLILFGIAAMFSENGCNHKNTIVLRVKLKKTPTGIKSVVTRKCINCGKEFDQ